MDGTLKGHRTSIFNQGRSGVERYEITTAYQCGSSADGMLRGVHFACREKLCTFVNAERDGCITGHGVVHFEGYAFAHRVWAQIPPLLKVLRPTGLAATIGFPKRFAIGVHESAPLDPDQQCRTSKQFLYDFFNWMGKNATSTPRRTYYDNFALTMHM